LGTLTTTRRKFTPEERLSILQEGEREGQASTIRKYHIAPFLYARWKHKYLHDGIYGLKDKHKKVDPAQ
jgi:putative transposase